jgi:hypothetical protein
LGEKVFTHLWEIRRERDFRTIMGTMERAKFLGSNSLLYSNIFLNNFGGKGIGA